MIARMFLIQRTGFIRGLLAATLLALAACGNGAGNPPRENAELTVSGNLTLKGSQPGAWWAVTDDQGRVWKISAPTPEQVATFQNAQNKRISIEGRRDGKYLNFEQLRPLRVIAAP
jgi:hypothetical protein